MKSNTKDRLTVALLSAAAELAELMATLQRQHIPDDRPYAEARMLLDIRTATLMLRGGMEMLK